MSADLSGQGEIALAVRDLQVAYGDFVAVQRATFSVTASHCVALIGPNGNGKSSIATAVAGLIASSGVVELYGEPAPRGDAAWMVQRGLVLVPERRRLFPQMTVQDNILLGCYAWTRSLRRAQTDATTEEAISLFPELRSRLGQVAGTLSGGQQQMTAIARGLAARPRALIIDEPCLGLADIVARRVYAALHELKGQGRTVILVEENPSRALQICDEVVRVERGLAFEAAKPSADPVAADRTDGSTMTTFGNLTLAGLTAGGMYAVFALCFVTLFRTAGILNLAVGDFAMLGALGTDYIIEELHVSVVPAIIITLIAIAVFAYVYDFLVLRTALEGRRSQEAVVVIFFFTFALSFFIEGVGKNLFGLDVRSPPALWAGSALSFDGLHLEKAGALVMILAAVTGAVFASYMKFSLRGKAMSACGQDAFAARVVGIRQPRFRSWMFVAMAVLAAIFGVVISPITGFVYSTGGTLGFFGLLGAAFAGFNRPGRAVIAGIAIGLAESYLGDFSTQYQDTLLYAVLVLIILVRPQILGVNPIAYS